MARVSGPPADVREQAREPLPPGAIARLGTLAFRHGDQVGQILVSPDGRTIFSRGQTSVRIWDSRTGRENGIIAAGERARFVGGSLLGKGDELALSCGDGSVHVWDWRTGREFRSFRIELGQPRILGFGASLAHSPDARTAAVLGPDGNVSLVDLITGKKTIDLLGGDAPGCRHRLRPGRKDCPHDCESHRSFLGRNDRQETANTRYTGRAVKPAGRVP